MFREYLHVEKFGNTPVEGIELGVVYVFPKLDGTNASAWMEKDYTLCGGSRTRELSLNSDNAGFLDWLLREENEQPRKIRAFLGFYPNLRLYGEWLVPHSFKGYISKAWKKFYVFDVYNDETGQYLSYEAYKPLLDEYGVEYIPPLAIIKNGDYGLFLEHLAKNFFLIPDGGDPGEGIVLKNYDYQNKFGEICFAKIIRNEFKEMHHKAMGAPEINASKMNEERILDIALTDALIDKTMAKIVLDTGSWESKRIPELFGRLFYDIITEELFDAWKEAEYGSINGKTLKALMINRVKQMKPEIFK